MGCVASTPSNPTSPTSSSSHPANNPARQSQYLSNKKHGITSTSRPTPSAANDDDDPVKPTSKRPLHYRHHRHHPNHQRSSLGPRHLGRASAASSGAIDPAAVAPDDDGHDDAVDNDGIVVTIGPPPPGATDAAHHQATSKTSSSSSSNNNKNRFSKSGSAVAALAGFDTSASANHPAIDTASTTSTMLLSRKVPVPVQARIAKFNEMDDVAIVLGSTSTSPPASTAAPATAGATTAVVANGTTPNSTQSCLQMSSTTSGVHDEAATTATAKQQDGQYETTQEGEDGHAMEQSKSASTIKSETPGTAAPVMIGAISSTSSTGALQKNAIYERIVDFERQAEETERLKTLVHKPKHEFKHGADIQLHQLERPHVFSSTAVTTT